MYFISTRKISQVWRSGSARETREGWPLLTVETEVNGDSKDSIEKGPSWLVRWACRTSTRDFYPAVDARVSLVQNIFFLTAHYFNLSTHPSLATHPHPIYRGMGG